MSLDIKQNDLVTFIKPYREIVQAGESHVIDKIIKIDNEVKGIYIKLDYTWIYMSAEMFDEHCKVLARKKGNDKFCDKVKESLNSKTEYDFINPSHYKLGTMETFDMMVLIWGKEKAIAHCEMTAFKYRMRAGKKPDQSIERDMEKAKWYDNKALELKIQLDNEQNS